MITVAFTIYYVSSFLADEDATRNDGAEEYSSKGMTAVMCAMCILLYMKPGKHILVCRLCS